MAGGVVEPQHVGDAGDARRDPENGGANQLRGRKKLSLAAQDKARPRLWREPLTAASYESETVECLTSHVRGVD